MPAPKALSNNRVLIPHLVIAIARLPQHLGRKYQYQLFDNACSEEDYTAQCSAPKGNAVKDFFSVKTGLDGEWGI